jgi:hypothetical protein
MNVRKPHYIYDDGNDDICCHNDAFLLLLLLGAGPAAAYAIHAWDIAEWIGDIYRAEQEASIRRREKLSNAMAKLRLMNRLGSAQTRTSVSTDASRSTAASAATGMASSIASFLSRGTAATKASSAPVDPVKLKAVMEADDSDGSDDSDVSTPRLLAEMEKAPKPVVMKGHT